MLSDYDQTKTNKAHILSIQSFDHTFGKKSLRKKPSLNNYDFTKMVSDIEERNKSQTQTKDKMNIN